MTSALSVPFAHGYRDRKGLENIFFSEIFQKFPQHSKHKRKKISQRQFLLHYPLQPHFYNKSLSAFLFPAGTA